MRGIIQLFRNIRVSKNFVHKKGLSLFSVATSFFSHCQKISWEELINVSELLRRGIFFCRGMRYHYFPLEVFFLTVPKKFVMGIIQYFRNFRAWKNFMQKGISLFSVGTFFSHSAKKYREGNHSMFQKYAGMEYFSAEEGHINIFRGISFSHSAEKFREGNHSMFQKFSGMEKFYAEGGEISIIC